MPDLPRYEDAAYCSHCGATGDEMRGFRLGEGICGKCGANMRRLSRSEIEAIKETGAAWVTERQVESLCDEALARIAYDMRCDAECAADDTTRCTRRLEHVGPHMAVTLDGVFVEWTKV